ncbi:MAG: OmpA family protein [Gammaproteobacteria bacterium]|nr:OmpA family protein [Gammaproteobacteria bacterium]MBT8050366.1 OmpA family protein [Gammaproteobacteria bacterium]MBT8057406.1 OmpA family protein [Gammaproteobacteria bacterium]NNJ80131.1 OmpA family protein [Xanthomonadales bacterium]
MTLPTRTLSGIGILITFAMLSACTTAPKKDLALEQVRTQLEELQSNEDLINYAPLALGEAERALRRAEAWTGKADYRIHLIYMADRRIQIARAVAQHEQMEDEYIRLSEERNQLLVRASQLEADRARFEAEQARLISEAQAEDARRAREEAEIAARREAESQRTAQQAQEEAAQARALAASSVTEAELARREAELATEAADTLRRQLENLQLRQTESGVVVTLGDVLFQTGETQLREEALASLVEVVDLLQSEPDKQIRIEGHTDSTGNSDANLRISQQRAEAVLDALVSLGVEAPRVTAKGMGQDFPIATNETQEGRAQNRRVDVILLDD